MNVDISTEIAGVKFKNPIILSACPVSRDAFNCIRAIKAGIAGVVTKTLNREAAVNPMPAIAKIGDQMLVNAEKWSDLTYEDWLYKEIKEIKKYNVPVIASIGLWVEDAELITPLVADSGADMIELVSYYDDQLVPMLKVARKKTDLPISVKVSANWRDVFKIAVKAEKEGADAITAIDSVGPVLAINVEKGEPYLGSETGEGWLSGTAIRPFAVRVVAGIAQRVKIPIFGVGGVASGKDIAEMVMAGASAVQICTVLLFKGLKHIKVMQEELKSFMERKGYSKLDDFRGLALKKIKRLIGEEEAH